MLYEWHNMIHVYTQRLYSKATTSPLHAHTADGCHQAEHPGTNLGSKNEEIKYTVDTSLYKPIYYSYRTGSKNHWNFVPRSEALCISSLLSFSQEASLQPIV